MSGTDQEQDPETEMAEQPGTDMPVRAKLHELPSPGQKLKKIREEKGLSEARVAEALHMTVHYVTALENDQYDKLPGRTFVKGYFRTYARLLCADVDEVLGCYQNYVDALHETKESEENVIRAKNTYDQNLRWMLCAAVIIVVVVGVSWWFSRDNRDAASAVAGNANEVVADLSEADAGTVSASTETASPVTAELFVATLGESNEEPAGRQSMPASQKTLTDNQAALANSGNLNSESSVNAEAGGTERQVVAVADKPLVEVDAEADNPAILASPQAQAATGSPLSLAQRASAGNGEEALLPDYSVTRVDDHRVVQLDGEGDDLLQVRFNGLSWIEVDDGRNTRLYHDMLEVGDNLTIRGEGPFNILVGDASVIEMTINSRAVNLDSRIRSDNSARILLQPGAR